MAQAPYPADTRAKGWRLEIDHERIDQSDTWALAGPEVRPWLLMLWLVAWKQTPCGSLPAEDDLIAARIGLSQKAFSKHRAVLMRGWWAAEDGRLYHRAMTSIVMGRIVSENRKAESLRNLQERDEYRRFRRLVLDRDGEICAYCGAIGVPLQLDHIIPRSKGGQDHPENLTPACRPCNARKWARTPEEWKEKRHEKN